MEDMVAEVVKLCRSCGEDLRHKERHKSRDGTYICPKCVKAKNGSTQRVPEKLAGMKPQLFVWYAIFLAIVGIVFWAIYDIVSQVEP